MVNSNIDAFELGRAQTKLAIARSEAETGSTIKARRLIKEVETFLESIKWV